MSFARFARWETFASLLVVLAAAWAAWFEAGDPDAYWHAAIGRHMWLARALPPFADPLSHTATGPFTYSEPLAELAWYALFDVGDVRALVAAKVIVVVLWLLTLVRTLPGDAPARVMAASLVVATSVPQLLERPYLLSFLLFTVAAACIERDLSTLRDGKPWTPRALVVVAVIALLWANLHGSRWLVAALSLTWIGGAWRLRAARPRRVLAWLALPALALLANPAGLETVRITLEAMRGASHDLEGIEEWRRTSLALVLDECPTLLLLLALAALGVTRRRRVEDLVLVALMGVLAVRARFIPYFALSLAPLAGVGASIVLDALRARARDSAVRALVVVAAPSILVAAGAWVVPIEQRTARVAPRLPLDAIAYLTEHLPEGVLWNSFDAGGPLTWWLVPPYRVSLDGRLGNTMWTRAFVDDALAAQTDPARGRALLDAHHVDVVFGSLTDFAWLDGERGWALVYRDEVASIWLRRDVDAPARVWPDADLAAARPARRAALVAGCARDADAIAAFDDWLRVAPTSALAWWSWRACMRAAGHVDAAVEASLVLDALAPDRDTP